MLNADHLKYFCDACRSKSLSAAAKRNYVSHSAVSQAIRSLESYLGSDLLVHAKRHFEITSEGQALFEKAEQILSELDSLPSLLKKKDGPLSGKLKIGLSQSLWNGLLKEKIISFLKKHPRVELSLSVGNSGSLADLLKNREIDLGFGVEDGSFARLERCLIQKGNFVLAARSDNTHPERYIVGDKGNEVSVLLEGLREKSIEPEISFVQSWTLIAGLVSQGLGIGLMPDFCLSSEPHLTKVFPRMRLSEYQVFGFYRSLAHLPPPARLLVESFSN